MNVTFKSSVLFSHCQVICKTRTDENHVMDEFHAHKVSISTSIFKYLLTWFFNEFKKYIYDKINCIWVKRFLKNHPLGDSLSDFVGLHSKLFVYCMKFRPSLFCSSYINKAHTVISFDIKIQNESFLFFKYFILYLHPRDEILELLLISLGLNLFFQWYLVG